MKRVFRVWLILFIFLGFIEEKSFAFFSLNFGNFSGVQEAATVMAILGGVGAGVGTYFLFFKPLSDEKKKNLGAFSFIDLLTVEFKGGGHFFSEPVSGKNTPLAVNFSILFKPTSKWLLGPDIALYNMYSSGVLNYAVDIGGYGAKAYYDLWHGVLVGSLYLSPFVHVLVARSYLYAPDRDLNRNSALGIERSLATSLALGGGLGVGMKRIFDFGLNFDLGVFLAANTFGDTVSVGSTTGEHGMPRFVFGAQLGFGWAF